MTYDPVRHDRRSIRLTNYDYTQPGAYFVTIVTARRDHLFGEILNEVMCLNMFGQIASEEWYKTAEVRSYIRLMSDEFIVMPNHIHGIIRILNQPVGATRRVAPTKIPHGPQAGSIGAVIAQYKSIVTKRINEHRNTSGVSVWQRNYWEHVIRNERALDAVRRYITENPRRWDLDRYNANATGKDPLAEEIRHTSRASTRRSIK